jgi:hypothetical protein
MVCLLLAFFFSFEWMRRADSGVTLKCCRLRREIMGSARRGINTSRKLLMMLLENILESFGEKRPGGHIR